MQDVWRALGLLLAIALGIPFLIAAAIWRSLPRRD